MALQQRRRRLQLKRQHIDCDQAEQTWQNCKVKFVKTVKSGGSYPPDAEPAAEPDLATHRAACVATCTLALFLVHAPGAPSKYSNSMHHCTCRTLGPRPIRTPIPTRPIKPVAHFNQEGIDRSILPTARPSSGYHLGLTCSHPSCASRSSPHQPAASMEPGLPDAQRTHTNTHKHLTSPPPPPPPPRRVRRTARRSLAERTLEA